MFDLTQDIEVVQLMIKHEDGVVTIESGTVLKLKPQNEPDDETQTIGVITSLRVDNTSDAVTLEVLVTINSPDGEIVRDIEQFELYELLDSFTIIK